MSIIGTIYEDVTTEVLGNIGVWQWLVVLMCSAITSLSLFNGYEDMFLIQPSKGVTCIPPERYEVVNASLCTVNLINNTARELKCSKWHVTLFWSIWIKKSWVVFCDSKIKLLSTTIICRMGLMFGCVMFGFIADNIGRRVAIMIDVFAQLALGIVLTFCNSRAWFQLLMFLKSLFGGAIIYMGIIVVCEISSNEWRSRLNTVVSTPRLVAMVFMIPFANAMPNLETLCSISTLFNIFILIAIRWTPESPQWLLFNRKSSDAEKLLYNAAKKNRIVLCSEFKIRPVNQRAYHCLDEIRTCVQVLATYNIRVLLLVTLLIWCLFSFRWSYLYAKVYSHHLNETLSSMLCFIIIFIILTVLLSMKLILRHLLLFNIFISGIFAAAETVIGHTSSYIYSTIALASGIMVHALLLNITPRLFALKIRATVFGFCHAIGQLGSMVGYLLFSFLPQNNAVNVVIEIGIMFSLATLCLILNNVDGRELPDMTDDMDYFSELTKPLRWATQKTNSPSNEEVEMRIYSFGSAGHEDSDNHSRERLPARRIVFWRSLKEWFWCVSPQT